MHRACKYTYICDIPWKYRFRGNTLYINIPLVPQGPSKM